ncbi:MAG: hypothetical protein NVS4B12_26440 [Ktedonobacteraceae bacterium]
MMQNQDRVGQQLGSYRLQKLLGKGGFAKVYLGEHIQLQAPVAVKVLNDTTLNLADQQSIITEARMIRKLKHPHIIKVTDFGLVDTSVPYIVMDYASNGTLQERHPKHSTVPLSQIETYVNDVASALQYAHDLSIIHCDVKPANMLVDSTNDILLSDFGIAVTGQASSNPALIKNSAIIQGTIAYIAPERLEQGITKPACDQYALGIVVYEWLAGVRPFEGTENQIMYKHVNETPPPLYGVYNNVTQEIEQVVLRALAKDPDQRYPSIKEFATTLSTALRSASQAASSISSQKTQPPKSNPNNQAAQPQQPQPNYAGYQGSQAQQQQANFGNQGTPNWGQPFPGSGQQGPVVLGSNPGHANTTTSFIGTPGHGNSVGQSTNRGSNRLSGQFLTQWNTLLQAYGGWFELDGEFARMQKNKAFRDAGMLLNVVSAVLVGVLQQSTFEAFAALFFSLGLFFLCVRLVSSVSSVVCGLLIALYWGYVGTVIGGGFSVWFPKLGLYAPATLLGLLFLSASAYLHIRYVQNRLS